MGAAKKIWEAPRGNVMTCRKETWGRATRKHERCKETGERRRKRWNRGKALQGKMGATKKRCQKKGLWPPQGNSGRRLKEMVQKASNGRRRHEETLERVRRKTWKCEETGGRRRKERLETRGNGSRRLERWETPRMVEGTANDERRHPWWKASLMVEGAVNDGRRREEDVKKRQHFFHLI